MIECGVLELDNVIDYGILVLGKTKAGKTTSSHYLTHQVLEGGPNEDGYLSYNLKEADRNCKGAKIGDSENRSETQIPNLFLVS
jgi:Cdc6-like AAA superfamily ATPase